MKAQEKAIALSETYGDKAELVVREIIESYDAIYDDFVCNTDKYPARNMKRYWEDVLLEIEIYREETI